MTDVVADLTASISSLHAQAPDLVSFIDGDVDPDLLPGELSDLAEHMRGFQIAGWRFDLLGENMHVDIGVPYNGPPELYRPIMDTYGNGVYFVDVDPVAARTGAVLCPTREHDIKYGAPTLLAFLKRAVAAASDALPAALAEVRDYASRYGEDIDVKEVFGERFADDGFFRHTGVVQPVPAVTITDPALRDITDRHQEGLVADLRSATPATFVAFNEHVYRWPDPQLRLSRYHGGRVVVAHLDANTG